jgi:hypothetical protein
MGSFRIDEILLTPERWLSILLFLLFNPLPPLTYTEFPTFLFFLILNVFSVRIGFGLYYLACFPYGSSKLEFYFPAGWNVCFLSILRNEAFVFFFFYA